MSVGGSVTASLAGLEGLGVETVDRATDAAESVNDLNMSAETQCADATNCKEHSHREQSQSWPGDAPHR